MQMQKREEKGQKKGENNRPFDHDRNLIQMRSLNQCQNDSDV